MSERVQQPVAPIEGEQSAQPDERVPAGVVLNLERFKVLAYAVEGYQGGQRAEAIFELNDLLIAMRRPGNDQPEAVEILKHLNLGSLGTLTDASGRNCRKEAVETLMAMGFPHALHVTPEDFEFARRFVRKVSPATANDREGDDSWARTLAWQRTMRLTRQLSAGVVVAGNLVQAGAAFGSGKGGGAVMFALLAALFSIGAVVKLASSALHPDRQALPLTALAMGTGLNLIAGLAIGGLGALVGCLANAIGLSIALAWQDQEGHLRR